jgi:hypothetical protein
MGLPKTLGAATVVTGTPTPVVLAAADSPFLVIPAISFSILNGIATILLNVADAPSAVFPETGYNGPNGYPTVNQTTGSAFDIHGGINAAHAGAGAGGGPAGGQQVTLWGFTTATYFNGKKVTVLDCNPATGIFRFYFNHADVGTTADAGKTAPSPFQHYRAVRLECGQGNGADFVYVGDLNVSAVRYVAALSLTGQLSIEIASENIPPEGIFIDGTSGSDTVQVSLIY